MAERRWAAAQMERALAVDVQRLLAQRAAEDWARRQWVAEVMGLATDDPSLGPPPGVNGWLAAAAELTASDSSRSRPLAGRCKGRAR